MKPTVLIFLFDSFSYRNFLFTPLWDHIAANECVNFIFISRSLSHGRVIAERKLPHVKWEYLDHNNGYLTEIINSNISFERNILSGFKKSFDLILETVLSKWLSEIHFRLLFRFNHINGFKTHRLKMFLPKKEREKHLGELEYLGWPDPGNKKILESLFRLYVSKWWPSPHWLRKCFLKYKPDLAVISFPQSVQGFMINREAQKRQVPVIAYINSWDQPTTKGAIPPQIKKNIVWNKQMRRELITYQKAEPEKIEVTGAVHLDLYNDPEMKMDRDEFLTLIGVNPKRKLIVYGTYNTKHGPDEPEVASYVARRVSSDHYCRKATLIIRPHPLDAKWRERFGALDEIKNVIVRPSFCYHQNQSKNITKQSERDLFELVNLMRHSDVVINGVGTLTLDAIAFDRPVINIGFDGDRDLEYSKSVLFKYGYDHYKKVIDAKGSFLVKNYNELDMAINKYLIKPELGKEGRQWIRGNLLNPFDGNSGRRCLNAILESIKRHC